MIESGMWTAFRARPFNRVPEVGSRPDALFMTCTDSEPLSPNIGTILKGKEEAFQRGAAALTAFAKKETFLCIPKGSAFPSVTGASTHQFSGKHPSGLAGTHINKLYSVSVLFGPFISEYRSGKLLATGKLDVERVISWLGHLLSDPFIDNPHRSGCKPTHGENILRRLSVDQRLCLSGRTAMGGRVPASWVVYIVR